MAKLQLVKPRTNDDQPQRGRGATISNERRYRYPAEEIWEVSDDRWRVAESRYSPDRAVATCERRG